jgi:hypothetical protein
MRILIKDPVEKITATFETKGPPCPGCVFRQAPRDYDEVEACMMANQPITGVVLKECHEKKWRKEGP